MNNNNNNITIAEVQCSHRLNPYKEKQQFNIGSEVSYRFREATDFTSINPHKPQQHNNHRGPA